MRRKNIFSHGCFRIPCLMRRPVGESPAAPAVDSPVCAGIIIFFCAFGTKFSCQGPQGVGPQCDYLLPLRGFFPIGTLTVPDDISDKVAGERRKCTIASWPTS